MTARRLPRSTDELRALRAARWLRESTRGQVDHYGPAAQRDHQDRAIARYELVDTGLVWEVAHSGLTVAKTAEYADMLARAGRDYDVLLVAYVSRLGRDTEAAFATRRQFHEAGAALFFIDEALLSSDDRGWESWAREAVEAEAYSRRLGRRITEGYEAKFMSGDQGGSAGLGFLRTPPPESRLAIDPAAMPKAVHLFERYATGEVSYATLERETGIKADAIRAILQNPIYNGWMQRHRRSPDVTLRPAPWRTNPPVSDHLWARVEAMRQARHNGGGGQPAQAHLLSKRLYCAECGRRIRAFTQLRQGRPDQRRYRHINPCAGWPQTTYLAAAFDDTIDAQITSLDLSPAALANVVALANTRRTAPPADELRRAQLRRQLQAKAMAFTERRISLDAFTAESARLNAELDAAPVDTPEHQDDPQAILRALRALPTTWRSASLAARQGLVRALFERIEVRNGRIVSEELTPYARQHGLAITLPTTWVSGARRAGGRRALDTHPIEIIGRTEDLALAKAG